MGVLFRAATGVARDMQKPCVKTYAGNRNDLRNGQQYKVRCVTAGILVFAKDASRFYGLYPYEEGEWK